MLISTRVAATSLLIFCFVFGWPILYSSAAGYTWAAIPVLLAAWSAAWFGEEVDDLIGLGSEGLIRGLGIFFLMVVGAIVAAGRWQWFA
jgi:hypothetical protein